LAISVENPVELLILQHPLEVKESKNSIRLLTLCAKNIQVAVGEKFSEADLNQLLFHDQKLPILLYPPTPENTSMGLKHSADFPDLTQTPLSSLRLVVLDATWKKSRKMLYLHPILQALPRLTLMNPPESLYTIRKAQSQNQLSSLEACCYAWRQLENNPQVYAELLRAFAAFVDQQRHFIESSNL